MPAQKNIGENTCLTSLPAGSCEISKHILPSKTDTGQQTADLLLLLPLPSYLQKYTVDIPFVRSVPACTAVSGKTRKSRWAVRPYSLRFHTDRSASAVRYPCPEILLSVPDIPGIQDHARAMA